MNVNEIIIEALKNNYKLEFKHPYNIDYRYDSFDIDFFLPKIKTFIILEYDNYNHEIYKDIKAFSSQEGYRTAIIPIHELNNENDLKQRLAQAIHSNK